MENKKSKNHLVFQYPLLEWSRLTVTKDSKCVLTFETIATILGYRQFAIFNKTVKEFCDPKISITIFLQVTYK